MASLGVDSSYIDAFCGRTPDSVLEKHNLDYSPRILKQIYRQNRPSASGSSENLRFS